MKNKLIILLTIVLLSSCNNKPGINQKIFSSDVDNFWIAYDQILATKDSVLQYDYINKLYLDKGTIGLKNIMTARNYTAKDYVDAINNYPKFWTSIRGNTEKTKDHHDEIIASIQLLKDIYPSLKTSPIYFTIGAFRTNGTILDSTVLIGCELAFADKSTVIDELPEWRKPFFKEYHPIEEINLLCTHEYVHTQQKEMVDNLLTYCLYEGVAEFVSTKALGNPSNNPAIQFGKNNTEKVRAKFEKDIFIPSKTYNWLWGENRNELKVRDLGYYIGYSICENHYEKSKDKIAAIKEMIELDFKNEKQIEAFVDGADFLSVPLSQLLENYEKLRPTVVSIEQFENGSQDLDPSLKTITLNFSTVMNKGGRGFDYGPIGEEGVLRVQKVIGFSEDGRSFSFEVDLKPGKQYQSLVTNSFYSLDGIPLKPLLIDVKTAEK